MEMFFQQYPVLVGNATLRTHGLLNKNIFGRTEHFQGVICQRVLRGTQNCTGYCIPVYPQLLNDKTLFPEAWRTLDVGNQQHTGVVFIIYRGTISGVVEQGVLL